MATMKKTKATETADSPELLAIKMRLLEAGKRICIEEGMCDDVFNKLYEPTNQLDLPEDLRPTRSRFDITYTVNIEDMPPVKHTAEAMGFDLKSATMRYLYEMGHLENPTWVDEPVADVDTEDTDEVREYKAKIRAFISNMKEFGYIRADVANKYLRFLGIEEFKQLMNYYFQLQVAPRATDTLYVSYSSTGYTEEEALAKITEKVARDEHLVALNSNYYREGIAEASSQVAKYMPAAEGATLVTHPTRKPTPRH